MEPLSLNDGRSSYSQDPSTEPASTLHRQHPEQQGNAVLNDLGKVSQEDFSTSMGHDPTRCIMPREQPLAARTCNPRISSYEKDHPRASKQYPSYSEYAEPLEPNKEEAMRGLKKDLGALVNFMTCIPFVSLGVSFYTLFAVLVLSAFVPLNFCFSNRISFRTQLRLLLLPATNLHYRCAWSESRATRNNVRRSWPGSVASSLNLPEMEIQPQTRTVDAPRNTVIITVHMISPILSVPMFFAAFVVSLWWIMSAITANDTADGFTQDHPRREGQGGFDEGQNLARALRLWWIAWLSGQTWRHD